MKQTQSDAYITVCSHVRHERQILDQAARFTLRCVARTQPKDHQTTCNESILRETHMPHWLG
jgi:hypothetical protein